MWDYTGYGNYHALQTSVTRRFDKGFMFSAFYVWSKALTNSNDDFSAGLPNADEEEVSRVDYSYANYDRPHNFVVNFIYQVPKVASGALGVLANDWQLSGIYRWTSGRPYPVTFSIPGIGNANLIGNDGNPGARVALTCDPGKGSSSDPYRQIRHPRASPRRSPAATAPSPLGSSCATRRSTTSTCRSPSGSSSARARSASRCASTRSTRSTTRSSSGVQRNRPSTSPA